MCNNMLDKFLEISPYSLNKEEKDKLFLDAMRQLTEYHSDNCKIYDDILSAYGVKNREINSIEEVPFIPVSLFKTAELLSVPRESVTRVMTSSGTTGQQVSRVFLDANTAKNQTKVLSKIIGSFIGNKRLPLMILDSNLAIRDRKLFSARGAGILGFSVFGRDVTYALDENMELNVEAVSAFLEKHKGEPILLFGYTFMIWKHFYIKMKEQNITFDFGENSTLFHVGGWKKLKDMAVDAEVYKYSLAEQAGIKNVYDYYGMAEQLGSIFVACEHGHLHTSIFSDIIARDEQTLEPCDIGQPGILQVMSVIPESYPGHSIITEDQGVILGIDDCPCGRLGKYFEIKGRLKNAEIRGCSDTYAAKF